MHAFYDPKEKGSAAGAERIHIGKPGKDLVELSKVSGKRENIWNHRNFTTENSEKKISI